MFVFHNLNSKEQVGMIEQMENSLKALLDDNALDGDALCNFVLRVAALVTPPRCKTTRQTAQVMNAEALQRVKSALQFRIRELLIQSLTHLDLTDVYTRWSVRSAIQHVERLIDSFLDRQTLELIDVRAGKQWRK